MEQTPPGVVRVSSSVSAAEDERLLKMASLLGLIGSASKSDSRSLPLLMANETAQAISYQVCTVWNQSRGQLSAISGVDTVERGAPLTIWAERCMKSLSRHSVKTLRSGDKALSPTQLLDREHGTSPNAALRAEWMQLLPLHAHAMWMPFVDPRSITRKPRLVGGMLLLRDTEFTGWEVEAASLLGGCYAQSMLLRSMPIRSMRRHRLGWGTLLTFLLVILVWAGMIVPVREGVLAPAEVVAEAPRYVRAPQPGIVAELLVKPGEQVLEGQEVARLDTAELSAKEAAARGSLAAAEAEIRQASQEAVVDAKARSRLPTLRAKMDEASAELSLTRLRLDRAHLLSPVSGVAVFDDPAEIIGKPVEAGERLMLVAPSTSLRIEARLPSSDDLPALSVGGEMLFHPNGAPLETRHARVDYVAHASTTAADGTASRAIRGKADGDFLRLGTRGTARIYGGERPFLLWALRRPITSVRQWLGR